MSSPRTAMNPVRSSSPSIARSMSSPASRASDTDRRRRGVRVAGDGKVAGEHGAGLGRQGARAVRGPGEKALRDLAGAAAADVEIPAMARMSSTKARAACGAWPSIAARRPACSPMPCPAGSASPSRRRPETMARMTRRFAAAPTPSASRSVSRRPMSPSFSARGGAPSAARPSSASATTSASAAAASRRPIELDAGMQELAGLAGAQPEHRAEIAVARRRRADAIEMPAADRDGVFGAKAELAAGRVLRHEHPAPDILAGEVDEDVGGLQHGRLEARVTLALEERDQRVVRGGCGHAPPGWSRACLTTRAARRDVFPARR